MIKDFRKKKDITQDQLADALGVTAGYISQIENEIVKVPLKFLDDMREVFGEEIKSIIYGDETGSGEVVREHIVLYRVRSEINKKIFENVKKIVESGNEAMIDLLEANTEKIMIATRSSKGTDENKGGQ